MKTSSSVLCFGELLIDMISMNLGDLKESRGFLKKFGGAPANTAMGLAKLEIPVKFMGKVGNDPFGHFLKDTLEENGVDTSTLILSSLDKTTLAFVSLSKVGERDFTFYRGAHENISVSDVTIPEGTTVLHFGSLTQIKDVSYQATEKLIELANKRGLIVSYDPNIRLALWEDFSKAQKVILETSKKVSVLKLNEEEALMLSETQGVQEAGRKLFSQNLEALFITLGAKGCYYKTRQFEGFIPTIKVTPVDTTGAGDAFNAGYLFMIVESGKPISKMSKREIENGLGRANIIGSLTTLKKGAITAFPSWNQIEKLMEKMS